VEVGSGVLTDSAPAMAWPGEGAVLVSLTIEIFGFAVAMFGVCQKPSAEARPMFEHAERIISRVLLHLHAKAALALASGF
jgi:hypothetical protein